MIAGRRGDRLAIWRPGGCTLQVEGVGHNPRVLAIGLHHVQGRPPVLPYRERDVPAVAEIAGPPRTRAPLPLHDSVPFPWPVSRYCRWRRLWKHREDNSDPVAGRTPCWSSARLEPPATTPRVNQRWASARLFFGLAGVSTRRRPSALAASDVYRSRPEVNRWGTRRSTSTRSRATARNHQHRRRGRSASDDPPGPGEHQCARCAT